MPLGSTSLLLASTLALSPFSTPWTVRAAEDGAWPNSGGGPSEKPAAEVPDPAAPSTAPPPSPAAPSTGPTQDPSWDEPDAAEPGTTATPGTAEPTPEVGPAQPAAGTTVPPAALPPPVVPPPGTVLVMRPSPAKGTGLIIGAGITGGLAWLTAIGRMTSANRCIDGISNSDDLGGFLGGVVLQCIFKTGPALLLLTPTGWLANGVTHGLAPAAGSARGKHDGMIAAWDGKPERKPVVFVGTGAALLGLGVVGRLVTLFTFRTTLSRCVTGAAFSGSAEACRGPVLMHFFGAQLTSASISGGAGLLAYGLGYKKGRTAEEGRRKAAGLASLKLTPQLGLDYSGLALTGRF
jgi:hypothetical protein